MNRNINGGDVGYGCDAVSAAAALRVLGQEGAVGVGIYRATAIDIAPDLSVARIDHYLKLRERRDQFLYEGDEEAMRAILREMEEVEYTKWKDIVINKTPTGGLNNILDNHFAGSTYTAAWYMGLVDGGSVPTFAAGDTMASHAGWTENTGYTQAARVTPSWSVAATGVKSTALALVFSCNAIGTIAGAFLASNSTKGGTTGTLTSAGAFTGGNQAVTATTTLNITYSYTLTSSN